MMSSSYNYGDLAVLPEAVAVAAGRDLVRGSAVNACAWLRRRTAPQLAERLAHPRLGSILACLGVAALCVQERTGQRDVALKRRGMNMNSQAS